VDEFEYEGILGRIAAKGKGAVILSVASAFLLVGATFAIVFKSPQLLLPGKQLAEQGVKLLKS
jgi:hypothetical protein